MPSSTPIRGPKPNEHPNPKSQPPLKFAKPGGKPLNPPVKPVQGG